MAKRPARQELRATPSTAPYRREKPSTAAPVPVDLPIPTVAAQPAPAVPAVIAVPAAIAAPVAPAARAPSLPDLMAIAQSALGFAARSLAYLPGPDELVHGQPTAAEPPPGRAPAGDARSLRSPDQFVLIYRHGASVISRRGQLGERGTWRVTDYPGGTQAAHAYALECSRLTEQGFRDVD